MKEINYTKVTNACKDKESGFLCTRVHRSKEAQIHMTKKNRIYLDPVIIMVARIPDHQTNQTCHNLKRAMKSWPNVLARHGA